MRRDGSSILQLGPSRIGPEVVRLRVTGVSDYHFGAIGNFLRRSTFC